jgi:hypothetical protein
MKKRFWIASLAALLLAAIAFYAYQRTGGENAARESILAWMPAGASAVLYADAADLRPSAFAAQFYAWAPRSSVDAEYAQFLRDTGFDYERDLDRVAIAVIKRGQDTTLFAIADGRFDRQKVSTYASRSGARENFGGREIFSLPSSGSSRKMSFTFLRKDRIAITQDAGLGPLLNPPPKSHDAKEWQVRFARLAGSPVFVVIRQDAAVSSALASQAPGGLQSPQLSALLDQLQWITVAGKPEGDRLRVVTEAECSVDGTARQLADLLNGILVLAQAGLNGPQTRQQLDPLAREAYLEILQGAEVSRLDRGETKSVRLMFDVTPKFLEAAKAAVPVLPAAPPVPTKAPQGKNAPRRTEKSSPGKH